MADEIYQKKVEVDAKPCILDIVDVSGVVSVTSPLPSRLLLPLLMLVSFLLFSSSFFRRNIDHWQKSTYAIYYSSPLPSPPLPSPPLPSSHLSSSHLLSSPLPSSPLLLLYSNFPFFLLFFFMHALRFSASSR